MTFLFQIFISLILLAQPGLQKEKSSIIIKGDSSMHEWEMELEDYQLQSQWNENEVTSINFQCKVRALKSGKSKMDENAYEAMFSEKFPKIGFVSKSIAIDQEEIRVKGILTIAGVDKSKTIVAKLHKKEKMIQFIGSHRINMEDHGLEAPTAMFGMMKVDPEVDLVFDLYFTLD